MRVEYAEYSARGVTIPITRIFWRDIYEVDHAASVPGEWEFYQAFDYCEDQRHAAAPMTLA